MYKLRDPKKGVILLIVLATILIITILAGVVLGVITNQSRLTQHKIARIKAYYAARGIMNYANYMIKAGAWIPSTTQNRYACLGNCSALGVSSPTYAIPTDADIPYNILVRIHPLNQADIASLNGQVTQLDIKVDYTYTP
ncbi:MAG: hypothetical protein PHC71_05735 [Candidatus Omnitrophica bacterium]|nr:hypothetical protein [Candidatus Omnitrophota bacterium]